MRSRNGGVDKSKRRPSEYSCRAPLGTQMPSRTNREFDWTTRADSGDLAIRSTDRQACLADTVYRRSTTVTDLAPPGRGDRQHARRLHGGGSRETRQAPTAWTVAYAIRKGMEGEATTGGELHHPFIAWELRPRSGS